MSDYINKENLIKSINSMKQYTKAGEKKGHWRETGMIIGLDEVCSCSECGTQSITTGNGLFVPMVKALDYCPCCGAKMYKGGAK